MIELTSDNYKEQFVYSNYVNLNSDDRRSLLEFAAQEVAKDRGLQGNVYLEFVDNGNKPMGSGTNAPEWTSANRGQIRTMNGPYGQGHYISINSDVLQYDGSAVPYSAFNTLNHEIEHAHQHEVKANGQISNHDTSVAELRGTDDHYYRGASGQYINGNGEDVGYNMYSAQSVEAMARAAGIDAVKRMAEENAAKGISDRDVESYIDEVSAEELAQKQDNIKTLGAHSREQMLREGFKNTEGINLIDRHRALKAARKQDFEDFKEVYGDQLDENELKDAFNNNTQSEDFFKTEGYKKGLKAEIAGKRVVNNATEQNATEANGETDEEFFDRTSQDTPETPVTEELTAEEKQSGIFYEGWDNEDTDTAEQIGAETEGDEEFFERTSSDNATHATDDGESDSAFFSRTSAEDIEEATERQNTQTVSNDTGENQSTEMSM